MHKIDHSSTREGVIVRFQSDASVAGNGFRLEWVVDGCGGMLRKSRGQISSPNYPNVYPGNMFFTIFCQRGEGEILTLNLKITR